MVPTPDLVSQASQLRQQGLTDNLIITELTQQGYNARDVQMALSQSGGSQPASELNYEETGPAFAQQPYPSPQPQYPSSQQYPTSGSYPAPSSTSNASASPDSNIYDRIEEITESLIDQKWDELIAEVKKIVEWKGRIETNQQKLQNDVDRLKEDFKLLHQGVLGKLDDYDARMRDVGTELAAVGKVFKDVIPEFVDNVKELSSLTGRMKK